MNTPKNRRRIKGNIVLKVRVSAIGRKEGHGFQIFNGFDHPVEVTFKKIKKISAVLAVIFFIACTPVHAEVQSQMAVRAIVGEASGEGYSVMLAHAHAIRNRGTLRGVHGLWASHIKGEPAWVWRQAQRAWTASAWTKDGTHGASYWFSEEDIRLLERLRPYWFMRLRRTVKIGSTTFYMERE